MKLKSLIARLLKKTEILFLYMIYKEYVYCSASQAMICRETGVIDEELSAFDYSIILDLIPENNIPIVLFKRVGVQEDRKLITICVNYAIIIDFTFDQSNGRVKSCRYRHRKSTKWEVLNVNWIN